MKLSAPVHLLKSRAKEIKQGQHIPMIEALDQVARSEGYSSWSLLQARLNHDQPKSRQDVLGYLNPGDLMLIGARRGLGKTKFALEILVQALSEGRHCYFFSLEYTQSEIKVLVERLQQNMGFDMSPAIELSIELSDDMSAASIVKKTRKTIVTGGVIVVDYLQLLDQKRTNPDIKTQIKILKEYAKEMKCIIIFISQIDRSYDGKGEALPTLEDVRMPNKFDVDLFNKLLLFHQDRQMFVKPAQFELS
jgi:replicative DNA helicase